MRDIFHRQWNDIKNAVSAAGLWALVLLMTIVFNMPFGVWDSGSWFGKIKEMAAHLGETLSASDPVFCALYPLICADLGLEPEGTPEHRENILRLVLSSDAWTVNGTRVSIRRWFGWFDAGSKYLPLWHSRLLILIFIGQALKVYKTHEDVPLWRNVRKPAQETEGPESDASAEDADDEELQGPAAGDVRAAAKAAEGAAQAHKEFSEDKGGVKEKPSGEQVKELRKTTKNTVFLCAEVLSRDGVRDQVAMLMEVVRPIYTDHANDARSCRAPEDVRDWYFKSARCHFMSIIEQCAATTLNLVLLKGMGFDTDYSKGIPKSVTTVSPIVLAQNHLAFQMVDVWTRCACFSNWVYALAF